jgi:hypothetical protein
VRWRIRGAARKGHSHQNHMDFQFF